VEWLKLKALSSNTSTAKKKHKTSFIYMRSLSSLRYKNGEVLVSLSGVRRSPDAVIKLPPCWGALEI
jgi:hypothetical protein